MKDFRRPVSHGILRWLVHSPQTPAEKAPLDFPQFLCQVDFVTQQLCI
jgi:hypothetical protein